MDRLLLGIFGFMSVTIFVAGIGLRYFLERWGTARKCWTYYTSQTRPPFAVLAHGMAAVAFWRAGLMLKTLGKTRLIEESPDAATPDP
jgi:hypothetical protein